ncbi:MAG: methionine ABC transporter permease [Burkholderiaceae bacterium]
MMALFITSFGETVLTVGASGLASALIGIPLGVALYLSGLHSPLSSLRLPRAVEAALNGLQSIPAIMILVVSIPVAHELFGRGIGPAASVAALSIIAVPLIARRVKACLHDVDRRIVESALTLGASPMQLVCKVLLPEASAGIAAALGLTLASLVGYSAMAGAISGSGLGDLGIRYGYREFLPGVMLAVAFTLLILAESAHFLGDALARHLDQR